MKSPGQIAAEALQDEVRARTAFPQLITLAPCDVRAAIQRDPQLQTEAMAWHLVDYCADRYESLPPEHMLELLYAADFAAAGGEPHIRLRIAKDFATALRHLGRFTDAEAALERARALIRCTFAAGLHQAVVRFASLALRNDIDPDDELGNEADEVVRAFEEHGALDRAYSARLYDAFMKGRRGEYVSTCAAYRDAARRAAAAGATEDLARAHYNIGFCLGALGDFSTARVHYAQAAAILHGIDAPAMEAKSLRGAARMTIQLEGAPGIAEMERVKELFLALGMAGEVCRSTVAVMQELLRRDPASNLGPLFRQLEEEITSLGLVPVAAEAMKLFAEALRTERVTDQILLDAWDVFGPTYALPAISAMTTVRH
jgi:tetratricopeptide (TPR) repeat protein